MDGWYLQPACPSLVAYGVVEGVVNVVHCGVGLTEALKHGNKQWCQKLNVDLKREFMSSMERGLSWHHLKILIFFNLDTKRLFWNWKQTSVYRNKAQSLTLKHWWCSYKSVSLSQIQCCIWGRPPVVSTRISYISWWFSTEGYSSTPIKDEAAATYIFSYIFSLIYS